MISITQFLLFLLNSLCYLKIFLHLHVHVNLALIVLRHQWRHSHFRGFPVNNCYKSANFKLAAWNYVTFKSTNIQAYTSRLQSTSQY